MKKKALTKHACAIKLSGLTLLLALIFIYPPKAFAQADINTELNIFISHFVNHALNLKGHNFEEKKQTSKIYFTEHGYKSFYKALEKANVPHFLNQNPANALKTQIACPFTFEKLKTINQAFQNKTGEAFEGTGKVIMMYEKNGQKQPLYLAVKTVVSTIPSNINNQKFGVEQWIAYPKSDMEKDLCDTNS